MAILYATSPFTHRIKLVASKAKVAVQKAEQQLFYQSMGEVEPGTGFEESLEEMAAINVRKAFKYRKLKQDPAAKLARRLYRLKARDPEFKRKAKIYRLKYARINKRELKKRAEVVREMKKRMPDPPSTPRTENHRKSN